MDIVSARVPLKVKRRNRRASGGRQCGCSCGDRQRGNPRECHAATWRSIQRERRNRRGGGAATEWRCTGDSEIAVDVSATSASLEVLSGRVAMAVSRRTGIKRRNRRGVSAPREVSNDVERRKRRGYHQDHERKQRANSEMALDRVKTAAPHQRAGQETKMGCNGRLGQRELQWGMKVRCGLGREEGGSSWRLRRHLHHLYLWRHRKRKLYYL